MKITESSLEKTPATVALPQPRLMTVRNGILGGKSVQSKLLP